MMADPTIIAAAIVTVIAALVTGIVTVVNSVSSARERADARRSRDHLERSANATEAKADTIIQKTKEIHDVTNSHLSKVTNALDLALAKIVGLEVRIVEMQKDKEAARDRDGRNRQSTRDVPLDDIRLVDTSDEAAQGDE